MNTLIRWGALALIVVTAACSNQETAQTPEKGGADEKKAATEVVSLRNTSDPNIVKIAVPSMQCESCASTITHAVKDVDATEQVDVDVENKAVFVRVSNNTPDVKKELETAISKSGYTTESMPADKVAYDALDECCKEGGMEKLEKQ